MMRNLDQKHPFRLVAACGGDRLGLEVDLADLDAERLVGFERLDPSP
jgi:hypothetical protein